jgi:hypothetical protein
MAHLSMAAVSDKNLRDPFSRTSRNTVRAKFAENPIYDISAEMYMKGIHSVLPRGLPLTRKNVAGNDKCVEKEPPRLSKFITDSSPSGSKADMRRDCV